MVRFSVVPKAELGTPPPGTVFASAFRDAVDLVERVYNGDLQVLDTTLEKEGEGVLENRQDDPDQDDF